MPIFDIPPASGGAGPSQPAADNTVNWPTAAVFICLILAVAAVVIAIIIT